MPMNAPQDDIQERYYGLLRLQRRVNKVLDAQAEEGESELSTAQETLKREVDKLVRLDADPAVFRAIERAAWEASGSQEFAKLARETDAKMRLAAFTAQHGSPPAFRKAIADSEAALKQKEENLQTLEKNLAIYKERLKPIFAYNHNGDYNALKICEENRKEIENTGFFTKEKVQAAANVVYAYNKANGHYHNYDCKHCLNDMASLAATEKEIEALKPQIVHHTDLHYRKAGAYRELRDVQRILHECGADEAKPADMEAFQSGLRERLLDPNFLSCFARNTVSGAGGEVLLAAQGVTVRQQIHDHLSSYRKQVADTTALLEGPIGSIARATGVQRAIDGIEKDIRAQALMAGYLSICAADALKSLASFRPDEIEGPASLRRDIQIHMAANGGVDPAWVHEVLQMDRALTAVFNVSATRPEPRIADVLKNPVSVERIDRHYAAFLRENAADEEVNASGFAAGQFDLVSFEKFLGRYFPAGTNYDQLAAALATEAGEIEEVENERAAAGITPGARLPEFAKN